MVVSYERLYENGVQARAKIVNVTARAGGRKYSNVGRWKGLDEDVSDDQVSNL